MDLTTARQLVAKVPHWHHSFEIYPGLQTPGVYNPEFLLEKMRLDKDLSGCRILDIGPSDGFFSREAHKLGADVIGVDYREKGQTGFSVTEELYGKPLEHRRINLYDLPQANLGQFDIIFFLGVLYHLPDMVRGLAVVRQLSRGRVYLETHCEHDLSPDIAVARYYVDDTLSGDWTNFWGPNRRCILDMLYDTGFEVVRDEGWDSRLFVETKAILPDSKRDRKIKVAYGLI